MKIDFNFVENGRKLSAIELNENNLSHNTLFIPFELGFFEWSIFLDCESLCNDQSAIKTTEIGTNAV